jgi:hypothetical protein
MKKTVSLVGLVHTNKVDVAKTFVEQENREVYFHVWDQHNGWHSTGFA